VRCRELEELGRDATAHDVHAGIVAAVLAAAGAVEAGHRVHRARDQLVAEHVALLHLTILAGPAAHP